LARRYNTVSMNRLLSRSIQRQPSDSQSGPAIRAISWNHCTSARDRWSADQFPSAPGTEGSGEVVVVGITLRIYANGPVRRGLVPHGRESGAGANPHHHCPSNGVSRGATDWFGSCDSSCHSCNGPSRPLLVDRVASGPTHTHGAATPTHIHAAVTRTHSHGAETPSIHGAGASRRSPPRASNPLRWTPRWSSLSLVTLRSIPRITFA
jgi:hypothetical protein